MANVPQLEIWSFNLRTEFAEDGPDHWQERWHGVAELILQHKPAVVCTQEATPAMLGDLLKRLGSEQYAWLGNSRSSSPNDETAGMIYHREQVQLEQHETRWLNPPGSDMYAVGWDASKPRTLEMATFVVASDAQHRLRVLNTHFDHVGVQARLESAAIIAEAVRTGRTADPELVQIVCGDFNSAKESSPFYKSLVSSTVGLRDAARSAESVSEMPPFTIHKFQGLEFQSNHGDGTVDLSCLASGFDAGHIDWVLWLSGQACDLEPLYYEVVTDTLPTGRYPSDHFPVRFRFGLRKPEPINEHCQEPVALSRL
mmetsp:Transcript_31215/g.57043  ORF Transcript_31215/g.57043 Transcript_31215/m.57043 type:complete len:313 (-) Transcript_31215:134-1072(-)